MWVKENRDTTSVCAVWTDVHSNLTSNLLLRDPIRKNRNNKINLWGKLLHYAESKGQRLIWIEAPVRIINKTCEKLRWACNPVPIQITFFISPAPLADNRTKAILYKSRQSWITPPPPKQADFPSLHWKKLKCQRLRRRAQKVSESSESFSGVPSLAGPEGYLGLCGPQGPAAPLPTCRGGGLNRDPRKGVLELQG